MTEREKASATLKNAKTKLYISKGVVRLHAKELYNDDPLLSEVFSACFELCDAYNKFWSESLEREERLEKELAQTREELAEKTAEYNKLFI